MKALVIGLGTQGRKRRAIAGADVFATVDPVNSEADYRNIRQAPLSAFDSAFVCTPDDVKFELLEYLLSNGKHVLVEKPLIFKDSDRIRYLATLAREKKAACYTAYNHRFEPHIARLKKLITEGVLGQIYRVSFFYGNGTARDVRNSVWRDKDMGVISDLGSHMLDMALFFFGKQQPFRLWSTNCFENKAPDQVIFGSAGDALLMIIEGTLLSWRNSFKLDVLAERGSAHIDGLCKWGPSRLTVRTRILPSGKPTEEQFVLEQPDPTWSIEYEHFKKMCEESVCYLDRDILINDALNELFSTSKESQ